MSPAHIGTGLRRCVFAACALGLTLAAAPRPARAAGAMVGPGGSLTLSEDLVLQAGDDLVAEGNADAPCTIEGNGNGISTVEGWQGRFVVRYCNIHGLGRSDLMAMRVQAIGSSEITLEANTLDASGGVFVSALDVATVQVLRNTVLETSVVPV